MTGGACCSSGGLESGTMIGIAFSVLTFFLAKFWKEAAQIIADIGDSALDANANSNSYTLAAPPMPPLAASARLLSLMMSRRA